MSENQFDLSNYIVLCLHKRPCSGYFCKIYHCKRQSFGCYSTTSCVSIHLLIFLVHILAKLFCISGPDSSKMVLKVSMPSRIQTHKLLLSVWHARRAFWENRPILHSKKIISSHPNWRGMIWQQKNGNANKNLCLDEIRFHFSYCHEECHFNWHCHFSVLLSGEMTCQVKWHSSWQ